MVTTFGPSVDDLVVLLLLSDQTVLILLLIVSNQRLGFLNQRLFRVRNDHVILTEGDAGAECVAEAKNHDRVSEQNRVFLTRVTIDFVNHVTDILLGEKAVDDVVRHFRVLRQTLTDQHPARSGLEPLHHDIAILIGLRNAGKDFGVQSDSLGLKRLVHFSHVSKARKHFGFRTVFVVAELRGFLLTLHGEVIDTQNHILRRNNDRLTIGG